MLDDSDETNEDDSMEMEMDFQVAIVHVQTQMY